MIKKTYINLFLLLIFLGFSSLSFAQKFWVGGSGDWNDSTHWSNSSGGVGGVSIPTINDDVVIDNLSFQNNGSINLSGRIFAKSLTSKVNQGSIELKSSSNLVLVISDVFSLSATTKNNIEGSAFLLNKGLGFKAEKYKSGKFIGIKNNAFSQAKTVDQTLAITNITTVVTDQTCPGDCDGSITATITGDGPFSLDWFDGNGVVVGTDVLTISNLCTGQYLIVVQDDSDGDVDFVDNINVGPTFGLTLTAINVSCPGGSNGRINATVIGGSAPFLYSWSNGQSSQNATGLSAGNYTLTVTDSKGCTITNNRTVTQPPPIVITATPAQVPLCGGLGCTEDVTFTAVGGTLPYAWSNGTSSMNMCPGDIYTSTLTDSRGCQSIGTHTASTPPVVTASAVTTTATCQFATDGTATASGAGGTAPYTYSWYDSPSLSTNATLSNEMAGTYNVAVRDANGCRDTATAIIPFNQITATVSNVIDVTCAGVANGSATASGSNGTAPYTYKWYDAPGAPTTAIVNNLPVGTFNVEVTDAIGCKDTAQVVISAPNPPVVTASAVTTDVVCLGLPTGTATASGAGGRAPYLYNWYDLTGNPTTAAVNNLNVGTYNVEVRDQDGCRDTATVVISAPNPPVIVTTLNPIFAPPCGVGCVGSATATAAGGTAPYTYTWYDAPGSPVGASIANLCPGSYNVAVADVNGCKDTVNLDISPLPIVLTLDNQTNIICAGQATGAANVSTSGGTAPYTYSWYDVPGTPSTEDLTNVPAGNYHLAIVDANGCRDTLNVIITQPNNPLLINIDNQVNNLCDNDCNGSITVSYSGGNLPIVRFEWINVPGTPSVLNLNNLCNGTYTFEVEDNIGCITTQPINITSPSTTVSFVVDPLCFGDTDADVRAIPSGGTLPYQLKWYDAPGQPTSALVPNLLPGTYHLEVIDANGCTDTFTVSFSIPSELISSLVSSSAATCQGICTGQITADVQGGTAPYSTSWYDMTGLPTALIQNNVCPGTYNLAVVDANGCRDSLNVVIAATFSIVTTPSSTQATCQGICDATASVVASNGSSPYTYSWYNAAGNPTSDNVANLCVGTYNVAVRDQAGCVDTIAINITAPVVVSTTVSNQVDNLCRTDCNGQATITGAGGTLPYAYSWTNVTANPTTASVTNLCNGSFYGRVTDANGCFDEDTIDITSNITTANFTVTQPSCGGYSDGGAVVAVAGGQAPYQLRWIDLPGVPTSNSVVGLKAGTYELQVTDANGCIDTFAITVTDPFPAVSGVTDFDNISCFGNCDGKAWVTVSGGFAPYTYSWWTAPSLSQSDTASSLCVGTYFVAISDAIGCNDTAAVTVGNPFVIDLADGLIKPCFGTCEGSLTATVTGDNAPFTFLWTDPSSSTNQTVTNLCPGSYKVYVTNSIACLDSATITLAENPQISGVIQSTQTTCTNTTNGTAEITVSGGTPAYQYSWYNNLTYNSSSANPMDLGIGKYYILVTDDYGCTYLDSVDIDETYFVDAFIGNDQTICEGDTVQLYASGGVSYSWSTGEITDSITVAPSISTTYTLTAVNNVCTDEADVYIAVNAKPVAVASADKTSIMEGTSTTISGSGGGINGTYDWAPPTYIADPTAQTSSINPLVPTRFYLTVTDQFGCIDTTSILINVFESIVYPDGISPNGDGTNDDWVILNIENFPDAVVEVYNRWGQQIFYSKGYTQRWDGTHKGKDLPVGTYYFIIDLGTDLPKYTGPITILR